MRVVADEYRQADSIDAMKAAGVHPRNCEWRRTGAKTGEQNIRAFEAAVLGATFNLARCDLLRFAVSEARIVTDSSGNRKIATGSQGGRRLRARDDAAVALVLAVAEYHREVVRSGMIDAEGSR